MPIRWRSPNHIDPTSTFTAFLLSVLAGARRFAHAGLLPGDRALHALMGLERFPTDDTIAICDLVQIKSPAARPKFKMLSSKGIFARYSSSKKMVAGPATI